MFTRIALTILTFLGPPAFGRQESPLANYYERWLKEDVVYIITAEEKAIFNSLATSEEKDAFIEQFWVRRDPSPGTQHNEFKEEHYRRIAYVNRHFSSGIPGWKTDRGRIYIAYGEPAEIEDHTGGGRYVRKPYEGGGSTTTYPFQVWRYRHIEGIGEDVEIEFVDRSYTGEFKMAVHADEKDLLLRIDGEGLTTAERIGLASKNLRYGLHPGNATSALDMSRRGMRLKDAPFERMRQFFNLQRPPTIVNKELKSIVDTKVTFNMVPFNYSSQIFWISSDRAMVPFTIELDNEELEYQKYQNFYKASVTLYGIVTGLTGNVVAEFEDRIASEYSQDVFEIGRKKKSVYQKALGLVPGTYKLELVVKDINSERMGTLAARISVPRHEEDKFAASPILLARQIELLEQFPDTLQQFVIGDVKAIPSVDRKFSKATDYLGVYLQAYNPQLDQATENPAVKVTYRLKQNGEVLTEQVDDEGRSIQYVSERRIVLIRRLPLSTIPVGSYTLVIELEDLIASAKASVEAEFEVVP